VGVGFSPVSCFAAAKKGFRVEGLERKENRKKRW
jgi:hypothetical protein